LAFLLLPKSTGSSPTGRRKDKGAADGYEQRRLLVAVGEPVGVTVGVTEG
jgi:hypothetical protein